MGKKLKIGGATVNQTPIDWKNNTLHIMASIEAAHQQNIDILCFPELCITGYGCEDLFLTDWLSQSAWDILLSLVPHVHSTIICVGLPIRLNESTYNGIAVIQNKTILGITLKQNLAYSGVHYEPRWFKPWPSGEVNTMCKNGIEVNIGDVTYTCKGVTFGFEICEDAWVKNRPAENLCRQGINLILNPSASHFALGKGFERESLVKESTVRYDCAYVYTNLLGNEAGSLIYGGDILIAHKGLILKRNRRFAFDAFMLQACEIDFDSSSVHKASTDNLLPEKNEEFTQALSLALFDYLRKSKMKGFVLSLSGGADSSCCAVAIAEMLKRASAQLGQVKCMHMLGLPTSHPEEAMSHLLTCVYQHTQNSSKDTFMASKEVAQFIGATFYNWSVDGEIASYTSKIEHVLARSMTWATDDLALQNIQARARVPATWFLANVKHCIFLTTSNRSEGDVGYATMDGDMSGSLAPMAGVDKPFILQWLTWAEKTLEYTALHTVNRLRPTAELRPASQMQTDEEDMMPYPLLLLIERLAICEKKSPQEVYDQLKQRDEFENVKLKDAIAKFFTRFAANQWKRERMAISFHLDDFNITPRSGYRFPVLSGNFYEELSALK